MKNNIDSYSTLYKVSLALIVNSNNIININTSDIVSIAFVNNYDTMTFPMIRIRLYTDINVIQNIAESPDTVYVRGNLDGGIYRMNDVDKTPVLVSVTKNIPIHLKAYIENKNIPTSSMDQYVDGIKKDSSLNTNVKVPIELFCYDEKIIHMMKQKVPSIYKDISLLSITEDILRRNDITKYKIDPYRNQDKFKQILIPNLDVSRAISFIEHMYGLYPKGGQVYGDTDMFYITNTDVNNNTVPLPIYVESYQSNSDMSGMKKSSNGFYMQTLAPNVSVLSETDIERTMNSPTISAVNLSSLDVDTKSMQNLYAETGNINYNIETPVLLHKTKNKYITDMKIARTNEHSTRIDISGTGFDIGKIKIDTRYNLIFESPIRGVSMNNYYRATYTCHVLSNLDGSLFIAQTTMNLCNN